MDMLEKGYRQCPNCKTWVKIQAHYNVNGIIFDLLEDDGIRTVEIYHCDNCKCDWEERY